MNSLLTDNIACLQQATDLVHSLPDALYARKEATCYNSSIGGHLRHVLDHYHSLEKGWEARQIDYEARPRDTHLETERTAALAALTHAIKSLNKRSSDELATSVEICLGNAATPAVCHSSYLRELQFLLSHTIHHFALIATIARLGGFEDFPEGFGIAPSTLAYLAASR